MSFFCKFERLKKTAMKKYKCDVCGWEYDPAKGDFELGIAPALRLKVFQKILSVLLAARKSTIFLL
jgi:hypothetical protein